MELVRTQHLPPYMTMSQFHKVQFLNFDIGQQAQNIDNITYCNTKQSKFVLADTGSNTIDGMFGTIMSYDDVYCQVDTLISQGSVWTNKDAMPMTVHTQSMGR